MHVSGVHHSFALAIFFQGSVSEHSAVIGLLVSAEGNAMGILEATPSTSLHRQVGEKAAAETDALYLFLLFSGAPSLNLYGAGRRDVVAALADWPRGVHHTLRQGCKLSFVKRGPVDQPVKPRVIYLRRDSAGWALRLIGRRKSQWADSSVGF